MKYYDDRITVRMTRRQVVEIGKKVNSSNKYKSKNDFIRKAASLLLRNVPDKPYTLEFIGDVPAIPPDSLLVWYTGIPEEEDNRPKICILKDRNGQGFKYEICYCMVGREIVPDGYRWVKAGGNVLKSLNSKVVAWANLP